MIQAQAMKRQTELLNSAIPWGFTIRENIGVGDRIQFTSLPENYFRATGKRLIDLSKSWIFDSNPYVDRESKPEKIVELWNFGPRQYPWPIPRQGQVVYQSNAEIWASLFGVPVVRNRPRLYRFEDFPFQHREAILFHTHGRSHGTLPDHVIDHVIKKYKPTGRLLHVGLPSDPDLGIPKFRTETLWDLAQLISQSRMFIGVDSGPAWVAACYPDVVLKKVRNRPVHGEKALKDWIPLEITNIHSHWDDRAFRVYNTSEDDIGFTESYKAL